LLIAEIISKLLDDSSNRRTQCVHRQKVMLACGDAHFLKFDVNKYSEESVIDVLNFLASTAVGALLC
jgi:hypothetical protein